MSLLAPCRNLMADEQASRPVLDPRIRVIVTAMFALVVVSLGHLAALVAALLIALAAAVIAGVEPRATARRLAALDGFMLAAVAFLPFTVPGEAIVTYGPLAASREGLTEAAAILAKSNAVVLMIAALLGTIETVALGDALARLGLPEKLVHLLLFTVRYIDVVGREYRRLRLAMKARGFTMGFNPHSWRSVGYLFGMLLVRSVERSERIVAAMRCRGFNGRFHPLSEAMAPGANEQAFAILSVALGLALVTLERL